MMGAHAERGGLFYNAAGVTPLFDAGSALSVNNGFLMAGAAGTLVGGTLGGNIISGIQDGGPGPIFQSAGNFGAIFACSDNKIYKLLFSAGVPSGSATSALTITSALTGDIAVFTDSSNVARLFYRRTTHIGRYNPSGTVQEDTWLATTDYFGAMHVHYGLNKIIFGNGGGKIGVIHSDMTSTLAALTFDGQSFATAIGDDGIYAIIAITKNIGADTTALFESQILIWDGSTTTGFLRNYPITDPFIYAIRKTPTGVFAFGSTGIWQVAFDGVRKVFSHSPGVYTLAGTTGPHYGNATSFFSDALLWGGQVGSSTARAVKSLGKLDSAALSAYLHPILGTASTNITYVDGQLIKGQIFIGDSTPQLKYYPIGSGTPQTSVSAQTVYFQLPIKYNITHVDVVFGEPLASGDSMSIQLKSDEDTAVTPATALAATYADDGAIRRKRVKVINYIAESQLSLVINFVAGAVKIKRIDIYGSPKADAAD